jgi:hypothetical protein
MEVLAEIGHFSDTQVVKRENQLEDVTAAKSAMGGIGMIRAVGKTAHPVGFVVDLFGNQLELFDQLLFVLTEFPQQLVTVNHTQILG